MSAEPEKIPQKHGGALLSGGKPGNKGGPGRPPSGLREACREIFEGSLENLKTIAQGTAKRPFMGDEVPPLFSEQIKAIDTAGKYGLGEAKVVVPEELAGLVADVLASCDFLTDEQRSEIGEKLDEAVRDR